MARCMADFDETAMYMHKTEPRQMVALMIDRLECLYK